MLVKFTIPPGRTVLELSKNDGVTEIEKQMPGMVFSFTAPNNTVVECHDGDVVDVPDDIYTRCIAPHKIGVPVKVAKAEKPAA